MIKIKLSYEHPEELEEFIKKLGSKVKRVKIPRQQRGKFWKAFIELKE